MKKLHVHSANGRAYCGQPANPDADNMTAFFNDAGRECLTCFERIKVRGYNMQMLRARFTGPKEWEKLQ